MSSINFDYNRAINQAKQIENFADELSSIANRNLESTIQSIESSWKGIASKKFIGNCTDVQADIKKQAKQLKELASQIRRTARILEDAEIRAKEVLDKKNSGNASNNGGNFGGGGGGSRF